MQKVTTGQHLELRNDIQKLIDLGVTNCTSLSKECNISQSSIWGFLHNKNIARDSSYYTMRHAVDKIKQRLEDEEDPDDEPVVIDSKQLVAQVSVKYDDAKDNLDISAIEGMFDFLVDKKEAINKRVEELESELNKLYKMQSLIKGLGDNK